MSRIRITEIFFSLQGETKTVGLPTIFVRLTGCPLRCQYCDTAYAFQGGIWMDIDGIFAKISQYKTRHVTITGGEPLAQKACLELLVRLCDHDYIVSLETSGAISLAEVDPRVIKVMDLKTPASGEVSKNDWHNLNYLLVQDQIKFVICNREDYQWSKEILAKYQLDKICHVLFSPSYQELQPGELADWILQDQLPVRMQIQLHKFLWGDAKGR